MSLDFTKDYSNHVLLDNKSKYSKLYKLGEADSSDVHRGDLVLLQTPCGKFGLFLALDDASEDGTLHLTKYSEVDFYKFDSSSMESASGLSNAVAYNTSGPCGCN